MNSHQQAEATAQRSREWGVGSPAWRQPWIPNPTMLYRLLREEEEWGENELCQACGHEVSVWFGAWEYGSMGLMTIANTNPQIPARKHANDQRSKRW